MEMKLNQKQVEYLELNGFKKRVSSITNETEWYKPYWQDVEFVYANYAMMAHFTSKHDYWLSFLQADALTLKLDSYSNKLSELELG